MTITAYRMKVPRILRGDVCANAGDTVYLLRLSDYGSAGDDTRLTGIEHVSVTLNKDGDYPFFTVPRDHLEPITTSASLALTDRLDKAAAAPVEPEPVGEVEPVAWRVWNRWNCSSIICQEPDPEFWVKIEPLYAAPIPSPAADVERLREALDSIRQYGADTLSGRADGGADDRQWQREAVREMTRRAREALSSVPSPAPAGLSAEETRKDNAPPASSPANDMIVEPRSPNLRG